ncbi:glucuronidase 3 [Striga asiatica]|uniref:Glucuronidase 3 n=1 Tax=Striga asiatica TaxID=4170 RepID=A0A5A7Q158_STRAF|nr:glucuronidase 3 [Striga asiatica]
MKNWLKICIMAPISLQINGITLLIINMDKSTTISAAVEFYDEQLQAYKKSYKREEYHLTPLNGDVQSQTVLLNNKQLTVGRSGDIPALEPNFVLATEPIQVEPYSIVFVRMPYVNIPACRWKHE